MGRMEKRDYQNYRALFYEMVSYLKAPDLVVYLKADVKTLFKQIKLRGRDFEQSIEKKYIERLNRSYKKWINEYKLGKVLVIESDNIDFVNNSDDFKNIISSIKKNLR